MNEWSKEGEKLKRITTRHNLRQAKDEWSKWMNRTCKVELRVLCASVVLCFSKSYRFSSRARGGFSIPRGRRRQRVLLRFVRFKRRRLRCVFQGAWKSLKVFFLVAGPLSSLPYDGKLNLSGKHVGEISWGGEHGRLWARTDDCEHAHVFWTVSVNVICLKITDGVKSFRIILQ